MGSHGDQLPGMRLAHAGLAGLLALMIPVPALAADCPTGMFIAEAGPDAASALEINANGMFHYMLSVGAVDEAADGRWTCKDGALHLTTMPTPTPPEFKLGTIAQDPGLPFSLRVTWPDGRGVPGVDFNLEMERGDPISDYTQESGWSGDLGGRMPRAVQVSEPFYGTASPRFPLPSSDHLQVQIILTPNDMGTADFRDTLVSQDGGRLVLHWRSGEMAYSPAADD